MNAGNQHSAVMDVRGANEDRVKCLPMAQILRKRSSPYFPGENAND